MSGASLTTSGQHLVSQLPKIVYIYMESTGTFMIPMNWPIFRLETVSTFLVPVAVYMSKIIMTSRLNANVFLQQIFPH